MIMGHMHIYISSRVVPSVKRWRQCAVVCTSAVSERDSSSSSGGSWNVSDWQRLADRQSGWKGEWVGSSSRGERGKEEELGRREKVVL